MTVWGLNVFARTLDPRVLDRIHADGWQVVRMQVPPSWAARHVGRQPEGDLADFAVRAVRAVEKRDIQVWVGVADGPEDFLDYDLTAYAGELSRRLPGRDFILDAEINNPEYSPGIREFIRQARDLLRTIGDNGGLLHGPGQTYPDLRDTGTILGEVPFDGATLHAYPDRGWGTFREWLDDSEALLRSHGYGSGTLSEVGAHGRVYPLVLGRPSTWLPLIRRALGSWNVDEEQALRLARLRAIVDSRPFWRLALLYQIADPPPRPDFGIYRADARTPKLALRPRGRLWAAA